MFEINCFAATAPKRAAAHTISFPFVYLFNAFEILVFRTALARKIHWITTPKRRLQRTYLRANAGARHCRVVTNTDLSNLIVGRNYRASRCRIIHHTIHGLKAFVSVEGMSIHMIPTRKLFSAVEGSHLAILMLLFL